MAADGLCSITEKLTIPGDKSNLLKSLRATVIEPGFPVNMPTKNDKQELNETELEPTFTIETDEDHDSSPYQIGLLEQMHAQLDSLLESQKIAENEQMQTELRANNPGIFAMDSSRVSLSQDKSSLFYKKPMPNINMSNKLKSMELDHAGMQQNLEKMQATLVSTQGNFAKSYEKLSVIQQNSVATKRKNNSYLVGSNSSYANDFSSSYIQNRSLFSESLTKGHEMKGGSLKSKIIETPLPSLNFVNSKANLKSSEPFCSGSNEYLGTDYPSGKKMCFKVIGHIG